MSTAAENVPLPRRDYNQEKAPAPLPRSDFKNTCRCRDGTLKNVSIFKAVSDLNQSFCC